MDAPPTNATHSQRFDAGNVIIMRAAKWLWLNAPHEMQQEALEHATGNSEVVNVVMKNLIRWRRDDQAELN